MPPMRFHLHTLLILLAIGPPMLAGAWAVVSKAMAEYRAAREREIAKQIAGPGFRHIFTPIGEGIRDIPFNDSALDE